MISQSPLKDHKSLKLGLLVLLAGLILGVAAGFLLKPKPPLIASVNVKQLVQEYIEIKRADKTSEAELALQSRVFIENLETVLSQYADSHNLQLVLSDIAVCNVRDVTSEIRLLVQRKSKA